jgi:DUF1009 family protein
VVQENMVLAVEAMEGTELMMLRASTLVKKGKKPVMVKIPKPGQDKRVDMPVIGQLTMEQLIKYNIGGIALEAGGTIMIESDIVRKMADDTKIFIIGVKCMDQSM